MNQVKICKTCKVEKLIDEYYSYTYTTKNKTINAHRNICKLCNSYKLKQKYKQKQLNKYKSVAIQCTI